MTRDQAKIVEERARVPQHTATLPSAPPPPSPINQRRRFVGLSPEGTPVFVLED